MSLQSTTYNLQPERGIVALITVMIVSAIGLTLVIAFVITATGRTKTAIVQENHAYALAYSTACAEEALQEIRDSTPFTGTGSLSLAQGACSYNVTSGGGQDRTIQASSTISSTVSRLEITIDTINPSINVTSWQEVSSF